MSAAGRAAFRSNTNVSRETEDLFEAYALLLERWNQKINLVSSSTMEGVWERHFLDSAQIWQLGLHSGKWVDVGSGGGFPGLVIAILGRKCTNFNVTLVESDGRKSAFLRTAARELGVQAEIITGRVEEIPPLKADTLSARALAPLSLLLQFVERHRKTEGQAILLKGEKADQEIADALEAWRFDCQKHRSLTDANSSILTIGKVARV